MSMILRFSLFLVLLQSTVVAYSTEANSTYHIYIIRHGEKKWDLGCLNSQGEARAANLVNVFNGEKSPAHETFKTPKVLTVNTLSIHTIIP